MFPDRIWRGDVPDAYASYMNIFHVDGTQFVYESRNLAYNPRNNLNQSKLSVKIDTDSVFYAKSLSDNTRSPDSTYALSQHCLYVFDSAQRGKIFLVF